MSGSAPNVRGSTPRPGKKSVDITGSAQTFDPPIRAIQIGSTAGSVVGQLTGDTADHTFYCLAGVQYSLEIKSITSAPAGCVGLY